MKKYTKSQGKKTRLLIRIRKLSWHRIFQQISNNKIQSKIPLKKVRPIILYSAKLSFKHGGYRKYLKHVRTQKKTSF